MDKCHNCGRTFLPDRLIVHLRSCDKAYAKKKAKEGLWLILAFITLSLYILAKLTV